MLKRGILARNGLREPRCAVGDYKETLKVRLTLSSFLGSRAGKVALGGGRRIAKFLGKSRLLANAVIYGAIWREKVLWRAWRGGGDAWDGGFLGVWRLGIGSAHGTSAVLVQRLRFGRLAGRSCDKAQRGARGRGRPRAQTAAKKRTGLGASARERARNRRDWASLGGC